jgi:hypothetical protein
MKKIALVTTLVTVAAVVMLFAVGLVGASGLNDGHTDDQKPPKTEGGAWLNKVYKEPSGAAVRIDFEVAMHKARRGLYVINNADGGQLASWYARGGEVDSGWISNLDLPRDAVWVEVLYYSGPGAKPVKMKILNHAPKKKKYGWVAKNTSHAIEVAWPDQPLMPMAQMSSPHN